MRLISKFHDYYDGAVRVFPEQTPIYLRKTKKIKNINYSPRTWSYGTKKEDANPLTDELYSRNIYRRSLLFGSNTVEAYKEGIIGFCGKIYPFFFVKFTNNKQYIVEATDHQCIYDVNKLHKLSEKHPGKYSLYRSINNLKIDNYFNILQNNKWLKSLFLEYKVPCFILEQRIYLTLNPCLKDYNFQTVMDPYSVVQELNMFLGNELAQESNLPVNITDDKVLQKAKGFDHKYSFRKEPTKRKK